MGFVCSLALAFECGSSPGRHGLEQGIYLQPRSVIFGETQVPGLCQQLTLPGAEGISFLVLKGGTWALHSIQHTALPVPVLLSSHLICCIKAKLPAISHFITELSPPVWLCTSPDLMPGLPNPSREFSRDSIHNLHQQTLL